MEELNQKERICSFQINGKVTPNYTLDECKELYNDLKEIFEQENENNATDELVDILLNGLPYEKKKVETTKHYIGDIKWVLYQYICDMNAAEWITIRCGNYAYEKISKLGEADNSGCKKINGESFTPINVKTLNKKQLIISPKWLGENKNISEVEIDTTIYPDDIVLYFA